MLGYITGLRALQSARIAMDVAGNNIANANTEGYSRQRALATASTPFNLNGIGQVGTGVDIASIDRVVDSILEGRILVQSQRTNRYQVESERLNEVQSYFSEPSEDGLSQRFSDFFAGLQSMQSTPDDLARRGGLLQNAQALSGRFRDLASSFEGSRETIGGEIKSAITRVNDLGRSIAELNNKVAEAESARTGANGLRDARQNLLQQLSEIADVQVVELNTGALNVLVSGHLLVTGQRLSELKVDLRPDGDLKIRAKESNRALEIRGGRIRGLLDVRENSLTGLDGEIDLIAKKFIQEINQVHATGIPLTGAFRALTSALQVTDKDGDGTFVDELLNESGLPFEIENGELVITMTHLSDESTTHHSVAIDPKNQTIGDLLGALNEVPQLTASMDVTGRMRLQADAGSAFDFAGRPDRFPDGNDRFGAAAATIATLGAEPFSLNDGDRMLIEVDGRAPQAVSFRSTDFADITGATAEEVAAAIRSQVTDALASGENGRVILQSATSSGSTSTLRLTDDVGTPTVSLDLSRDLEVGGVVSVDVEVTGAFEGGVTGPLVFKPERGGDIGVTDGLRIGVFDSNGDRLASLDVGPEYVPGTTLDIGFGLAAAFSAGTVSATSGDQFELDVIEDSDTSRILSAFQFNAFFTGDDASNISVSSELLRDPRRLAGSVSGEEGDNRNFLRLDDLSRKSVGALGGDTIQGYYGQTVANIGSDVRRATSVSVAQSLLLEGLDRRRDEVSGVSIDEEIVNLERQQQLYEAAARFIQTLNQTLDTVLRL